MNFTHCPVQLPYTDLVTESIDGKRHYITPNGDKYPSITNIISEVMTKKGIEKWRKKVGEETANRISKRASSRGTRIHEMIEHFINNEKVFDKNPVYMENFLVAKNTLCNKINNVYAQEVPLYSDQLRIAGRVDCIADFDGIPSIIDFKTASKPKKESYIESYFVQGAFYGFAWKELTNRLASQIVIIIINDEDPQPQIFIKRTADYVSKLVEVRRQYDINLIQAMYQKSEI
jgi:ATP-dependent exoDNAse (exonuclease V) beta subunit